MMRQTSKMRHSRASLTQKGGLSIEKTMSNMSQMKEEKFKEQSYSRDTKETVLMVINHPVFKLISSLFALYALYADDVKLMATTQETDFIFSNIIIMLCCFFFLEITITFFIDESYACSLFFWTDIIGTVSLLLDIETINNQFLSVFNNTYQSTVSNKTLSIIRFSKNIRSIRIVRLVKLFNLFSRSKVKDNQQQQKLSKKFEDLTLKKVVLLILLMLISSIAFNPEMYWPFLSNMELSIQMFSQSSGFLNDKFNVVYSFYIEDGKNNVDIPLVYSYLYGREYLKSGFNSRLRIIEKSSVQQECLFSKLNITEVIEKRTINETQYEFLVKNQVIPPFEDVIGSCFAIYDNRQFVYRSSMLSIVKTSLILVIFTCGFFFIENDMKNLVFLPLEKMTKKIKVMSRNPIASMQEDTEKNAKKSKTCQKELCSSKGEAMLETTILEKKISKICALLVLGFGEAGSQIISSVLQEGIDVEMNPLIPGKKVVGIYGFCDIRNFTDTTDVLQEKVMIFVNQVAEIVHEIVSDYCGSANKNIGDAFLLVWKFESKFVENDNGTPRVKKCAAVSKIADMALISFILILIEVQKSFKLGEYRTHPLLNQRMKNYAVKMGFGLHLGYSIEGAIGSMFKIDASYLSPNVDMANKLEEKTKEFGKELILSGEFVDYLSEDARRYVRLLDQVKNDQGFISRYYTVDLNLSAIEIEDRKDSKFNLEDRNEKMERLLQKRQQSLLLYKDIIHNQRDPWKELEANPDFQQARRKYTENFMSLYSFAIESYIKGSWTEAKQLFERAEQSLGDKDVPIDNFLHFMSQSNYEATAHWDGYKQGSEAKH